MGTRRASLFGTLLNQTCRWKMRWRDEVAVPTVRWSVGLAATGYETGRARHPNVSRRRGITHSANRRAISPRAPSGKYSMK
jgi:hypothetical protein